MVEEYFEIRLRNAPDRHLIVSESHSFTMVEENVLILLSEMHQSGLTYLLLRVVLSPCMVVKCIVMRFSNSSLLPYENSVPPTSIMP